MSGMYHDFGAIPNRKGSRQSEVSESQERSRPSSRRLSRLSSTANTEDRTNSSAGTPQPEGSSKRIRQKRKEYSPEVEEKKKPAIVLTKRAPRKSGSTVPSTPKEQSPPQELGKRETRKKSRFSPSPQSSSKPVKEAEEVEERFLLSMISDALKNLPEVDYDLPKDIKVWAKRRANATARKAVAETAKKAVNVNPSTPDEVEADETFEEAQLQQVRILFDDERPIHEHLFEQIPVKVEEPDDYETAGPSNNVLEEELEDIKPVIAAEPEVPVPVETPAPKKRKAPVSSGKKGKQATPDKEPVPKRSKRGQKEPSPAEEPKQEEVEGRRSRRSTAGFKELMAGLVSGSRPKSTPKLKTEIPKAAIKKKVEEKEETPVSERVSPEPEPVDAKIETDTPKTKKSKKEKTPEPSPEPVAPIRRSSRSTVPSSKLPESGKKDVEFKVKPKPGSALEILKKTSRYQRVQRSPTPETPTPSPAPSKTSGSSSVPITPETVVQNEAPAVEVKPVEEEAVPVPENIGNDQESEKKMKRRSERNRDLEERLDQMIKNTFTENADYSEETFEPEEEVPIEQWSPDSSPTTFDSPRGTIKLVSKKKKKCATKEKTPEKQIPSPANVATRRSSRAFKPKISDEDFVFEVPVVIRKEIEASPSKKSPLKSPSPVKKEMRLRSSSLTSPPKEDEETAAEKTRKYVEEHKGPIKLSFKIGSEVATVVKTGEEEVETEASTPTEEEELIEDVPTEEEEMIKIPSAPAHRKRKEPHWWNLYTPTPKPVLENFTRPDGTIEHLGVVINSVMDALLLKVCDDGIRRHSNKMAKEARKAEMSEMAKKRYYEKKRIAEERQARGEPALPFPVKKTSAELFAHTISTRERTKKGALYKNNEYLLKPVKLQREADMEREHREQEARDYLNRQFMREAEEDLKREARGKGRMTKAVKHVSFKDFTDTKGGATTQVLRPTTTNPDFFHREILREPEELTMVPESDEVSVDDEEDMPQNLCSTAFIDQAKTTSDQICNLFVRDPNVTSYTDILGRLIEEPEIRQAIIANAIEVLIDFQQVKFGTEFSPNAHVILHNEATTRAYDLRDSFSLGHAEKETMCWAHGFLIQNLPADYLPGYLILLRYWKHHNGSAVASFAKKPIQEEVYPWAEVTELIWSYILNKVVDPDRENLQATIDTEVLSDVIFVLVPPAFQYGEYSSSSKAHENIYRWLKMMGSKESYIMKMDYECRPNESVYEAIEFYTTVLKNDLSKLVREMRNKRIVLVGWGLTAYMCHRVVQLTHGVSAIIDLAFPLRSVHGYRGGPDDDILLTYCPSLFVVGAQDKLFSAVALKELRTGMQTETGAVVIHYADSNLYVPSHLLNRHNITQRTVSRSILEYIVDFLKLPCTKKERSQLIQADLNAVYTVEVDSLKAIVGGAPTAPQRVQKHATIDGGKPPSAPRQRKRKADFSLPPSLLATPQAMPALLAEVNASGTTAEARYRFDEIVRSARTGGTTSDVLSPTPRTAPVTFTSSPLPSPSIRPASHQNPLFPLRGPPLPSPLARTAPMEPSGHLLDPANISLS